jgi:hypothetical protein
MAFHLRSLSGASVYWQCFCPSNCKTEATFVSASMDQKDKYQYCVQSLLQERTRYLGL